MVENGDFEDFIGLR